MKARREKTNFLFISQDLYFWCSTPTKWVALIVRFVSWIGCWGTLLLGPLIPWSMMCTNVYRKNWSISRTFFRKVFDQNRRCSLSARPFASGVQSSIVRYYAWLLSFEQSTKQKQQIERTIEKLSWMEKYLSTNTRIISIICHKWWTWFLFYLKPKLWVRLQRMFRFIVGEFTLEEDRRLLTFFTKNFFCQIWSARLGVRLIHRFLRYVPGIIVNYIHVIFMETNTNVLASTRDQCFAIASQNQVKILSNKLKYFIDVVNPLLIYLPPPPRLNHIVKTPSLLSTLLSPSPLFVTTKLIKDKLY